MTDSHKHLLYRTVFFSVLLLAVYWQTLGNRFVWDDLDVIVKNPLLEHLSNLPRLFLFEDRTGDGLTGYYRPMTYISFMLDRAVWGLNPLGFNITNLFLHLCVSLLLFEVISALFKRELLAYLATAIFALHPVASETVNFHAGGRNTLLSACFALLSLLCYLKRKPLPSILFFTAAIFSKEFALLLPAIFLLHDRYSKGKSKLSAYFPYILSIACYLTIRSFAVAKGNLFKTIRLSDNLLTIPQLVVNYLKNMVFPFDLKVIYDLQPAKGFAAIALYFLALSIIVIAIVILRKKTELAAAACWFFLFLLPVTGIFPLGSSLMADRYAYFSLMGFSLALGYGMCSLNKRALAVLMVLICLCFATIDRQRNAVWNNLLSLYLQMTKDAPEKSIGFTNVGMYYYEKGDLVLAEKYLEESCSKKGIVIRDALQYLSAVYWENKEYDKALSVLTRMIALEPENPQPYIMASRIYQSKGDTVNAKIYHDQVVAKYPRIEQMMQQRVISVCKEGEQLMAERKPAPAERKLKEALMMQPDFVPALIDMGSLAAEKGDMAGSLEFFSKAGGLDPNNPSIHYNMSRVYELMGRMAEAKNEMTRFKELDTPPGSGNRH